MHPDRLDDDSALRPRSTETELSELSEEQRRVLDAVGHGSTVSTLLDELQLPADRLRAELLALLELQLLEVTAKTEAGASEARDSDAPADSEKRVVQSTSAAREASPAREASAAREASPTREASAAREASPTQDDASLAGERDAIRPAPAIHLTPTPYMPVQPLPTTSSTMRTVPGWSSSPLRPVSSDAISSGAVSSDIGGASPAGASRPASGQTLLGGFRSGVAPAARTGGAPSDASDSSPPTQRGYSAPPPAAPARSSSAGSPGTGRSEPTNRAHPVEVAEGASEPMGLRGRTLLGFRAPLEQIASYEQRRSQRGAPQDDAAAAPAVERRTDSQEASALDAFEVLDCLAKGGRGVVYLVRERATDKRLALKVLRQDQCESQPAIDALTREARLLEIFDHPNLVRFEQFDREGDEPFLLMEYIEGLSAARLLHYPVPMPLDVGMTIALDALEALFYVHDLRKVPVVPEGLVHADVSPENLLIGTDGITRLIDFGSSCGPREFANPQRVQAKLGYASPELLRGDEVDFRSDVFSIGAVLFHFLGKLPPFSADPAWREREHSVPKPSQLNPRLPKVFDAICQRALHPDANKRYASIPQLRRELERALKTAQIECRRERVGEWVQRVRESLRGDVEFSPLELKELLEQEPARRASNAAVDAAQLGARARAGVSIPPGATMPQDAASAEQEAPSGQVGAATRFAAETEADDGPLTGRARLWITLFALAVAAGILYIALVEPQALNRWMPPPASPGEAP